MKTLPAAVLIFAGMLGAGLVGSKLAHPNRSFGSIVRGEHEAEPFDTVILDSVQVAVDAEEMEADDEGDAAVVEVPPVPAAECLAVPRRMVAHLAGGLNGEGKTIRLALAVRGVSPERPFLIAAELDGPGLEGDGDVAVWSANSLTLGDGTRVMAEDDLAAGHSGFDDARGGGGPDADALNGAVGCVRAEEEEG
ncbi:MAG TPA: hypothetical protein VFQ39_06635 [Longimicrobium sp.]|nr:hypothetical protein [Longimicrobium sp.]